MAEQKKLSLCVIMKEKEESYPPGCLESMEGTADEIFVVNIGFTGHISELAPQANVTVYHPKWEDDFSKIKNFCMERASGDWVLFLYANETIPRDQLKELKVLMLNPCAEGYLIEADDTRKIQFEVCPAQSLRLIRNRENYRFQFRSSEYIPDEELYSVLNSGIRITCSPELASGWQAEERIRLLQLDLKERPKDGYVQYLQGIELLNQKKYEESAASFELARHALCGGYLYAPHLYKCLGICLLALFQHEVAEEVLAEGVWLFPSFIDLYVLRAKLYHRLSRDVEALSNLNICLSLHNNPNACVPKPRIDISDILMMQEEIQKDQERNIVKV